MPTPDPIYRLVNPDLLRTLMQRTGTGSPVTIRELADASGVSHGTVHNLLTGKADKLTGDQAHAAAKRIGVDLLILWEPVGRATGSAEAVAA